MPNYKIPHSIEVAAVIRANVAAGVPMRITFDQIKEMKNGPRSYKTLYSTYRGDIVDARATLHAVVGQAIMNKALVDGDMQALTLIAKGRLGWNEKILVEEVDSDDVDEDSSAVDAILAMLKLKKLDKED